jgi:peptide/nickel transport system permease protein
MLRSPRGLVGLVLTGAVLIAAVFAPLIAPHDPAAQNLVMRLKPPVWEIGGTVDHLLGTDQLGRDLLSRIIYGARTSLSVVGVSVVLASTIGVAVGLFAGYFGGLLDQVSMRLVDVHLAFPALLMAIVLVAVLRPSMESVIVVLVLSGWVTHARIVRGQVLTLREREYVQAALVTGASPMRVMVRHILPNLISIIIVIGTIQAAQFILLESALSFLGLGILPPTASWGSILNEGRRFVFSAWWIQTFPGIAIVVTVAGCGLLGDWLRDYLDPRLRVLSNG